MSPTNHPAAERAYRKYESCFDVPEEDFAEPDLPAIVTAEYTPLVEAAWPAVLALEERGLLATAETLEAALRDTVGEP